MRCSNTCCKKLFDKRQAPVCARLRGRTLQDSVPRPCMVAIAPLHLVDAPPLGAPDTRATATPPGRQPRPIALSVAWCLRLCGNRKEDLQNCSRHSSHSTKRALVHETMQATVLHRFGSKTTELHARNLIARSDARSYYLRQSHECTRNPEMTCSHTRNSSRMCQLRCGEAVQWTHVRPAAACGWV